MTISVLIKKLEEARKRYGDLAVTVGDKDAEEASVLQEVDEFSPWREGRKVIEIS
jgi:hypothetical protein